jgi:membrane peptidoglycan carboxypeptidase
MSNASVVIADQHNGDILTLIGNIDPDNPVDGDFDVATQGYRQMGSSFKPYIYATAFSDGISPGDPVFDGPLTVTQCCGLPPYIPMNYDLQFHGLITYRYALQNSFNIPAVKLLMTVGVDNALKMSQDMGISTYTGTPNNTMVLGSLGVHLIDHVQGYTTFANEGIKVPLHAVTRITDQNGQVILNIQPKGTRVLSAAAAWMTTNVLTDNKARNYEFGPCSSLVLYSNTQNECYAGNPGVTRPVAAKTGTTNNFNDNLTMGYTTDYTVGVWVGNNDNTPMVQVDGVTGAGPIWNAAMKLVEQGHPIQQFPGPPPDIVQQPISNPAANSGGENIDWYFKK